MENIQRLFWPALEQLYFGNVTMANKTIQSIADRAPNIKILKVLRSTHRFSRVDAENGQAWIGIDIQSSMDRRRRVTNSCASSFYSQAG